MHRLRVVVVLALVGLVPTGPARAACPTYQVQRGDTLRIIAEKFFGTRDASNRIYRANAGKIGADPNLIEVGQVLYIPCDDGGPEPSARPAAVAARPAPQKPAAPPRPTVEPSAASSAGVVAEKPAMVQESTAAMADDTMAADTMAHDTMAKDATNLAAHGQDHDPAHDDADMAATDGHDMAATDDHAMDGQSDEMQADTPHAAAAMADMPLEDLPRLEPPMPNATGRIYLLTGGPFSPFAGQDLPQGGMIAELVQTALAAAGGPPTEVVFVNDRASHLDGIMPRGGFAMTFPWVFPDCAVGELSTTNRALCDRFRASDGFYEFVTEFYARADLPWAGILVPQAMAGARICRPLGYPVDDLVALGLLPDKIELIRGKDAIDCLMQIDRAEADLASMDAAVTRSLIDQVTVQNPILVLEPLTRVQKLRVLAPRDDPQSAETIRLLNTGLRAMSEDGRWFEIVNRHLRGQES